jgi:hypothetical protein
MPLVRAAASTVIKASPESAYAIIADYREGHPTILPKEYFKKLEVERGGVGAGTVIKVTMELMGTTRTFRAEVTEPVPGRTLAETDPESEAVTTFTVEPWERGGGARVTITTEWPARGIRGWIERLLAPRMLAQVYAEELRNLADEAARRSS